MRTPVTLLSIYNPSLRGAHPESLKDRIADRLSPAVGNRHDIISRDQDILFLPLHHRVDVEVYLLQLARQVLP